MIRSSSRPIALVVALVTIATTSGCSFLTMRDPPPRTQMRYETEPDCTDGRGAPAVDLIASGFSALTGLFGLALASAFSTDDNDDELLWFALVFGGATVLFGASSVSGFRTARRCRAATEEWYTMRAQMQFAPRVYQPPLEAPPSPAGLERGRCRLTVPACDPGLACASGFCVRPPPSIPPR